MKNSTLKLRDKLLVNRQKTYIMYTYNMNIWYTRFYVRVLGATTTNIAQKEANKITFSKREITYLAKKEYHT